MNHTEFEESIDLADKIGNAAGKIANTLIQGLTVKYGPLRHEFYDMKDVQEYLLLNDEFCARFDKIHLEFMLSVEDSDKAVPPQIAMDELTQDAVGSFAELKAEQVMNYWMMESKA